MKVPFVTLEWLMVILLICPQNLLRFLYQRQKKKLMISENSYERDLNKPSKLLMSYLYQAILGTL